MRSPHAARRAKPRTRDARRRPLPGDRHRYRVRRAAVYPNPGAPSPILHRIAVGRFRLSGWTRLVPTRSSASLSLLFARLFLIGVPRFELGTSPTRTELATRMRQTPRRPTG